MTKNTCEIIFCKPTVSLSPKLFNTLAVTKVFLKCFLQKLPLAIVQKKSFPIVRYFNGILLVFTLVFLKCVHYSTDFGTRMTQKVPDLTNCCLAAATIWLRLYLPAVIRKFMNSCPPRYLCIQSCTTFCREERARVVFWN